MIPLRVALLVLIVFVAVAICLTTFIPLYLSGAETGNEFSRMVRRELGSRLSAETWAFFSQYHPVVQSVNSLVLFGCFDSTNVLSLIPRVCDAYRRVNMSSYVGLENGIFVKCVSYSPGVYHAQIRNITTMDEYFLNESFAIVGRTFGIPINYDPRLRPWYRQLRGGLNYSDIYLNFSTNATTITAGGPLQGPSSFIGVFATDVFPIDVVNYFKSITVAKTGHALLVEESTRYILGSDVNISALGFRLLRLDDTVHPDLSEVRFAGIEAMSCKTGCVVEVGSGRARGFVESRPVDPNGVLRLRLLVITYERDFLGLLHRRSDISIALVVVVAVVILVGALAITSAILTPLRDLGGRIQSMAELSNLDDNLETSVFSELEALQQAFIALVRQMTLLKSFVPQTVMEEDAESSMDTNPLGTEATDSPAARPAEADGDHPYRMDMDEERRSSSFAVKDEMKLNSRRLQQQVNTFSAKRCSVLIAELACHRCSGKTELQDAIHFFMETVVGAAMQFRGVIEMMRPEVVIVTFSMVLHETRAVDAAIKIAELCGSAMNLVTVAVDSGEYYTGNCGAKGRVSRAVFGPMIDTMRRFPELINRRRGTMLAITEATASAAKSIGFTAFPVDLVQARIVSKPIRVYDIAPTDCGVDFDIIRQAFNYITKSQFDAAITLLETDKKNPHSWALRHRLHTQMSTGRSKSPKYFNGKTSETWPLLQIQIPSTS